LLLQAIDIAYPGTIKVGDSKPFKRPHGFVEPPKHTLAERQARARRIEAAAFASLEAWDGEEESVRAEHKDMIEELRVALEGPDAVPDKPYDADDAEEEPTSATHMRTVDFDDMDKATL